MPVRVRPARRDHDAIAELLYVSAAPYYDAFAGSPERARRLLAALTPRGGHTASWEVCHVAELDGAIVGVMAAFPARDADALARRFLNLGLRHVPIWRWSIVLRHLRAASSVSPVPPDDALYVDALAVAEGRRRQGVASALLATAEHLAAHRGASGVALDTGLKNAAARALYRSAGFVEREIRHAPSSKVERAVGGPGFVAYFKPRAS